MGTIPGTRAHKRGCHIHTDHGAAIGTMKLASPGLTGALIQIAACLRNGLCRRVEMTKKRYFILPSQLLDEFAGS
jgi:hypothetical protein